MTTRLYTQEAQSITWEYKVVAKKFQMKDEEGGGMACFCHAKPWLPVDILEPRCNTVREDKGSRAISSGKSVSRAFYVK